MLDQCRQRAGVVAVFMGEQDGGNIAHLQTQLCQRSLNAAQRDPRIHQQVRITLGEQKAVALRPAGQCM